MNKLDELRALLAKATPGPWEATTTADPGLPRELCHGSGPTHPRPNACEWHPQAVADAELISTAVNALPDLLDVVEAARALKVVRDEMSISYVSSKDISKDVGDGRKRVPVDRIIELIREEGEAWKVVDAALAKLEAAK